MQSNTAAAVSGPSNARLVEALTLAATIIVIAVALINNKIDYDRVTRTTAERAQAQAVSMATDVRWY
ncbi:MAG: hypothetical protein KF874_10400, partial [Rhizobiaceae bacterium]|nr:hypothetical protein [Rhizobiaceae bacterium]